LKPGVETERKMPMRSENSPGSAAASLRIRVMMSPALFKPSAKLLDCPATSRIAAMEYCVDSSSLLSPMTP